MNKCLFVVWFLLCALTVAGQEQAIPVNILKAYTISALKDEYRIGLERELKHGKSIEYGMGYVYRIYERNDCKECMFALPLYYSPYRGRGGAIRVNFNTYKNSEKRLEGVYSSLGLKYSFIDLDKPKGYPSGPTIPYGYAISNQHALSLQGLFGRKFNLQHLVTDIYAGINVQANLNSYERLREEYKLKDPALHYGVGVNLGVSLGYRYNRKPNQL